MTESTIELIKKFSIIILCLTIAVCAGILTWRLSGTLHEVRDTAAVMHGTADDLSTAVKEQIAIFRSPAYQKNYEHASELGDIAAKTVAQIARQTIPRVNRAVDELTARLQTLDGVLLSVRGVTDEAQVQVKQNGDATAKAVGSLDSFIRETDTRVSKLLDDGSLLIETLNPKLQDLFAHADNVIISADGTFKAFQPVVMNFAGVTDDLHGMSSDSRTKLHEIFWPPKVVGFWPNVKRTMSYLLTPVLEGTRVYFQLHSLPVRITQPIPILKP